MNEKNYDNLVVIDQVDLLPQSENIILGFSLDTPQPGLLSQDPFIEIGGWVLGHKQRVSSIRISCTGQPIYNLEVNFPRPDVSNKYPAIPDTNRCGFSQRIGIVGLPEQFELVIETIVGNNKYKKVRVPSAVVKGRVLLNLGITRTKRQPLMVTGLARSGSTWLMRILSEVPGLLIPKIYPYETRPAVYWMHVLKVLSDPANFQLSTGPDSLESWMRLIGHNPYNHPDFLPDSVSRNAMNHVHGAKQFEKLTAFCKSNIDDYYDMIEMHQGQKDCSFFAEKQIPSHIQNLLWSNYSNAKEIVLVRDFRDIVSSAIAFNKRRNAQEFGRDLADSDEQWIKNIREDSIDRLLRLLDERGDRIFLLKYEDLINEPREKVAEICTYLSIDIESKQVKNIIKKVSQQDTIPNYHQTSSNQKKSIGRWKGDMDDDIKQICTDVFGDALRIFGYL